MNIRRYLIVLAIAMAAAEVFAQRTPPARPSLPEQAAPVRRVSIVQKYAELGGASGRMGAPTAAEAGLPDGVGRYRLYANGIILWHPDTGAHALQGAIYRKYVSLSPDRPGTPRFLTAPLASHGYPTTDETTTADGRGVYNAFQRGVIYYIRDRVSDLDPTGGAVEMHGPIYEKWRALFHAGLDLGYPTTDQRPTPDRRGQFNHFDHGSIYWTAATGAHEVHGDIRERWKQSGWERGPLGYPTSDERDAPGGGRISDFERGSIRWRVVPAPLSIIQYNTALLPRIEVFGDAIIIGSERDEYRGKDRIAATNALIANLRRDSPDIIGLSEVFISSDYIAEFEERNPNSGYIDADNDRQRIKDGLATMYPHVAEIPVRGTGTFEVDLPVGTHLDVPRATELIFFSKWPITARNHHIYRNASGADTNAAKGILHIRVQPPGHPTAYDLFLTHTQNPDEGANDAERRRSRQALNLQADEIATFIATHSSAERPALLMGDLNFNANAPERTDFLRRLGHPASLDEPNDVWLHTGRGSGITWDAFSTFRRRTRGVPATSSERGRRGQRLDWFLSWPGSRFWPTYETEVLIWQFGDGHDISDHYGVKTRQVNLRELSVIQRVAVRPAR